MNYKLLTIFLSIILLLSGCSLFEQPNTNINIDDGVPRNENGSPLIDNTTNSTLKISLHDGNGNPISSVYDSYEDQWVLNIHDSHVHSIIVNQEIHRHTEIQTTLAEPTLGDGTEYIINVTNSSGFSVGDYLHIENGLEEPTHPVIKNINGNLLTLDRRIDYPHPVGTNITKAILNLALEAGNLSNPVIYSIEPPINTTWHLQRILFSMSHSTAGDLGLFGDLSELSNGVIIRALIGGQYFTLTNWKTNSDMKTDMFDVEFDTRSGGGGSYGTSGRYTLLKSGAVLRLEHGDRLEILIQDDITNIDVWTMKAQGHIVGR